MSNAKGFNSLKMMAGEKQPSRRDFMKFCGTMAAFLGMGPAFAPTVAHALTTKKRPSVVYLHCAECTGCTEGLLRAYEPYFDEIIMSTISLDYCETVMAAAGHAAHAALEKALRNPEGYICVIEGGIPTLHGGEYGKVGAETMFQLCARVASKAIATIAMGSCASFGGVQAAAPNPSGAKGTNEALEAVGVKAINIAGCPPNPMNFVGTVVHLLTKGMPELDNWNRPKLFYADTVHAHCPRQEHFNKGEFAPSFDSKEAKKGWCLYKLGCKGPYTYNNCPTALFNQVNWPVQAGAPCIGCSEPNFWDDYSPFFHPIEDGSET
ncbi:hydrogenase small subunit [Salidesulfovibrio brasiliensis]|uniref:hydrogenase small subunit n=1 Tax=Salidesulfovibrio brasiliensis TaxID=221711 RepID=UPI0006D1665C|nr:hydrogenase small subunit [Salidesulfovibrio brasiliensis]